MSKFVGIKNNKILIVSDHPFNHEEHQVIETDELDNVNVKDIISDYKIRDGKVVAKKPNKTISELRVAFVSNWKMRCGIATYSEFLYTELTKQVGDYKLFIERNDIPTGPFNQIGGETIPEDKIVPCWKRGESLQVLIKELKAYDPDVILIQHEFGIFPNAAYWISMMNQLSEYRVIVTMHSIFHHRDKTIVEAAMPEIIVHLDGAKTVLQEEKGVPGKIHVIPHGSFPCLDRGKLWNFYKSNHTFMQFGFGYRYKGWQLCIQATAILKQKYPDVFFTGLFSESPYNKSEHQLYYNDLMELVEELGVEENVGLIRGYQSDASLDSYLRTNQATVFPYVSTPEHEVYGASGAARLAMSKGIAVITTSVNHFSDLPSVKANTPEEIAKELEQMFLHPKLREEQVDKQIEYINDTSWSRVADKYTKIFENMK